MDEPAALAVPVRARCPAAARGDRDDLDQAMHHAPSDAERRHRKGDQPQGLESSDAVWNLLSQSAQKEYGWSIAATPVR